MGNQIYFKIAEQVDLDMVHIFAIKLNIYLLQFFKYNTKSIKIFKKIDRRAEPPDTFLEENHPMTISSKYNSY